jgi:hypothetical protein
MLLVVNKGSTTLHELDAALQKLKINYRGIEYGTSFNLTSIVV